MTIVMCLTENTKLIILLIFTNETLVTLRLYLFSLLTVDVENYDLSAICELGMIK